MFISGAIQRHLHFELPYITICLTNDSAKFTHSNYIYIFLIVGGVSSLQQRKTDANVAIWPISKPADTQYILYFDNPALTPSVLRT